VTVGASDSAGVRKRRDSKNSKAAMPVATICVLVYGNYFRLATRVLNSILRHCPRPDYRLVVGANAPCLETLSFLRTLRQAGEIDRLVVSPRNIGKCPMMRRLFTEVETDFIWWFDDDSYILEPTAWTDWLQLARQAPMTTVIWGQQAVCDYEASFTDAEDAVRFVRTAPWYRGLPPPYWRPGGKGEFDFEGRGTGDGRWLFMLGGCWLIRTRAIRALDWPDRRLIRTGDDVFLGEAIRQNGWELGNIGTPGVAINTEPRRGEPGGLREPNFGANRRKFLERSSVVST